MDGWIGLGIIHLILSYLILWVGWMWGFWFLTATCFVFMVCMKISALGCRFGSGGEGGE